MLEGRVTVVNDLGLHARAAAQLVRLAGKYRSRITLRRDDSGSFANAKSILSVLALAAAIGTVLTLEADGADEQEAFDAVTAVFAEGFGEM
ncbi:MAG TPA: HPr family phosphocarrier protein [Pyrinomonadaceae bacterium]|nr:HPr family phosphocarrier protein [Pyrinomonadaceae bacterium]